MTMFTMLFVFFGLGWAAADEPRQEARAGTMAAVCLALVALVRACAG